MSYVDFFVNGSACSGSSSNLDKKSVPGDDPNTKGNLLGFGGFETEKESALLDSSVNEKGHSNKEKESGLKARVGEASCFGGKDSTSLDGLDVCSAKRNGIAGSELVLCIREERFVCEPLSCCPPMASSWVLQKVKDICHFVGPSCEEFDGKLLALLTATETSHNQKGRAFNSKSAIRSNRELKRLSYSINYDSTGGCSSHSRVKGRGISVYP